MNNKCLVTRLKAVVNDDSLPVIETMQQFTLDAIDAGGNKSMSDAQKWALNHFFYQIGAISNSGIWSKVGFAILPIIGANKNYYPYDFKNNVLLFNVTNVMRDTNGGLEVYYESPNATSIGLNSSIQNVDGSSIGCFVSSVKQRTINSSNAAPPIKVTFGFDDNTNISLSCPEIVTGGGIMQLRYQSGIDYYKRLASNYYNNYVRSTLLNINGTPSSSTISALYADVNGNLLKSNTPVVSGNYTDTSEKSITSKNLRIGSGNVFGVLIFFKEALTEAECSKLIQANQELIEAF